MEVFLDARRSLWNRTTGTGVYAENLTRALAGLGTSVTFHLLRESRFVTPDEAHLMGLRRYERWLRKILSDFVEVPFTSRRSTLSHLLHPEAAVIGPYVLTIQDLDVLHPIEKNHTGDYYGWRTIALAKRATAIICPTQMIASQVTEELKVRCPVFSIPLGIDPPGQLASVTREIPYLLYSGGWSTRKNAAGLFKAWNLVRDIFGGELVVTGMPPADLLPLPGGVRCLGSVSREHLWALYAGAEAIVYPSTREGFGFPILEGALLGRPVVCGPVGIVPELPNDLVISVATSDPEEIAEGILLALGGWCPAPDAIHRARERFTWTKCAQQTLEVYLQSI